MTGGVWQFTGYGLLLVVAAALSFAVAGVAWTYRDERSGLIFTALMAGAGMWALGDALQVAATTLELKLLFRTMSYVSHNAVCVGILVFTLAYTGHRRWLSPRTVGLLGLEPAVVALVVTPTNALGLHGLLWRDVGLATVGGAVLLSRSFGPWYWVNTAYNYLLVVLALLLLVRLVLSVRGAARMQGITLVAGSLPPFVANVAWVAGLTVIDFTPIAFSVTGIAFGLALFRYRLLELTPVARDTVLDAMQDGYVILDADDRIADLNRMARHLVADSDTSVVGTLVRDTFPAIAGPVDNHAVGGDDHSEEIQIDTPDGPRYFAVRVSSLTAASSFSTPRYSPDGRIVFVNDVTDRVERERTLEAQNQRLDRFTSVVSHDLRNPLNVAQGHLGLARETGADEHFDAVERSVDRMETLVEDLLALSRQGETVDDPTSVDLRDVAEYAWSNVDTAGATLSVTEDVHLAADRERLAALLENLFRNSVEHGSANGGASSADSGASPTSIRVGVCDEGFYAEDDGPGIPSEQRDRVFDHGYSTSTDGTGFGLSIVEEIAHAHGWEVTATVSVDGGARFEIGGVNQPSPVDGDSPRQSVPLPAAADGP